MAEATVIAALARQGWCILAHNWRWIGFELDIVARKGRTLLIVEVKARGRPPQSAWEALALLPARKRQALQRGANAAASRFDFHGDTIRVDLAIVHPTPAGASTISYYVEALR